MEIGCIGFMLGAFTAIIFVGIGMAFGKLDNRQSENDNDVRIYVPVRRRDRGSDQRNYQYGKEEIKDVLSNVLSDYKLNLTPHEKNVFQYLINKEIDDAK